jgi:hypothetical protein
MKIYGRGCSAQSSSHTDSRTIKSNGDKCQGFIQTCQDSPKSLDWIFLTFLKRKLASEQRGRQDAEDNKKNVAAERNANLLEAFPGCFQKCLDDSTYSSRRRLLWIEIKQFFICIFNFFQIIPGEFLPEPVCTTWFTLDISIFIPYSVLSLVRVTIDGVWIGNWIYWTLTDSWLQVITPVSLIHTLYSSLAHTFESSQSAMSTPVVAW